ncbi:uncharacterized protein LJ206_004790 isoform 1-T1 [Theristicus caerulescens]
MREHTGIRFLLRRSTSMGGIKGDKPQRGDSKQELADGCIVSWWPQPSEMSFGISIKVGIRLRICRWRGAPRGSVEEEEIIHSDSSCGWILRTNLSIMNCFKNTRRQLYVAVAVFSEAETHLNSS